MNLALLISNEYGLKLTNHLIKNNYNVKLIIWAGKEDLNIKKELDYINYNSNTKNDIIYRLKKNNIDIGIVFYFKIIPEEIFSYPRFGMINIHYSLLYSYAGPTPVEWQIYNKEKYTGVSIHFITKEIDKGKIIFQEKIKMPLFNNKALIYKKLFQCSKTCVIESLRLIELYGKNTPIIKSNYSYSYFGYFEIKE